MSCDRKYQPQIHIYIYIWNILNLQISFLSMLREFKMLYILWREISLSLARGCNILFSCQFFSSLFFVRHPIIFSACLFSKYGYHFSFHRSMMKEFTIISTPDLRCISFYSPMYGERYMTSSSRLFTFEDISQIFPDTGFTILLLLRTIGRTISCFLFHFQQGYNKT